MRTRSLILAAAVVAVAACGAVGVGCSSADGGITDPVVDDDAATTTEDSGATIEEDTTPSGDDVGPGVDSTTPTTDTAPKADTAVADTAKPDTGTTVTDTGSSGDWPAAYAALEEGILVETNKRRAAGASCGTKGSFGPAGPLVMQYQLQASARKHSKDMATNNFFAHNNLAGKTPFDRMKAEGYKGTTMGENIAAGNATVAATMDQWMKSDGHCANIMNKSYTQLGVGYWYNATSTYKHYWTQNFGAGG
jgi:uncharacterized protein YkwD